MRRLLALPFIPHEHIEQPFHELRDVHCDKIQQLREYISETWMNNSVWTIAEWSVFMQPIRTNNDVEGWHRMFNIQAKRGRLPVYLLIELLHNEARMVHLQAHLVSERKLRRYQRKKFTMLQGLLEILWREYTEGIRSTSSLCSVQSRTGSVLDCTALLLPLPLSLLMLMVMCHCRIRF